MQSKPFLYISEELEKPKVLGWGEYYSGTEQFFKISVFNFQDTAKYVNIKPIEFLIAFFRLGIREVTDKKAYIRPKIYVHGLYSLDGLLPEDKESIIEKALIESGATKCVIE